MTTYSYYTTAEYPAGGFGNGALKSITNALGHVTQFTSYDANGRLLSVTDPNGFATSFTYNFRGQVLTKTTIQQVTTYAYDPVGQLIKVTLPDGSFYAFTYDPAHRLTDTPTHSAITSITRSTLRATAPRKRCSARPMSCCKRAPTPMTA